MSVNVSRTAEPLRFDVGIGNASFAEVIDSPVAGQPQKSLLPGSTTVTQAVDELFPTGESVRAEVMAALVSGNSAALRTPGWDRTIAEEEFLRVTDEAARLGMDEGWTQPWGTAVGDDELLGENMPPGEGAVGRADSAEG